MIAVVHESRFGYFAIHYTVSSVGGEGVHVCYKNLNMGDNPVHNLEVLANQKQNEILIAIEV